MRRTAVEWVFTRQTKSGMEKRTPLRNKHYKTAAGSFALLAVGTLPTLFSNPLEYLMGLGFCLLFAIGITLILC